MSSIPVFDPTGPVTTVYHNGIPMLEQHGERFTYSEYDKRNDQWTRNPVWIPHGQRSMVELKDVVDKLIAKLKEVETAVISAQVTFKNHFATLEPPVPSNPYISDLRFAVDKTEPRIIGDSIDPRWLDSHPMTPVEELPSYTNEQKKTQQPARVIRKRAPRKKKVAT